MAKEGAKPKYETAEEMQAMIEAYFTSCEGKVLTGADGKPVLNKYGQPIIYGEKPLTMSGLARALGFKSRQTLLNYKAKAEFMDTVTRAKQRVEEYVEGRLFDKDGSAGAKFSLENNFGWASKQETKVEAEARVVIIDDIPDA